MRYGLQAFPAFAIIGIDKDGGARRPARTSGRKDMLYSQEDKQNLRKQLIRRIALTAAIFLVPFACGLVIMYTSRQQWLSWLLSVVGMAAAVLFYGLCVSPFVAYAKYLREVTAGMSRSFQGGLLREESVSVREGVRCRTPVLQRRGEGGRGAALLPGSGKTLRLFQG